MDKPNGVDISRNILISEVAVLRERLAEYGGEIPELTDDAIHNATVTDLAKWKRSLEHTIRTISTSNRG